MSFIEIQLQGREENTEDVLDKPTEGRIVYVDKSVTKRFLSSTPLRAWILLVLFSTTVPILVYYLCMERASKFSQDGYTCLVKDSFKVTCGSENISVGECLRISCCYDKTEKVCHHFLPSKYGYNSDGNSYRTTHTRSPYGTQSVKSMKISFNEINADRLDVVLHIGDVTTNLKSIPEKNYEWNILKNRLIAEVYRKGGKELLLSTAKGPLIASQKYWEWTVQLTTDRLFGLDGTLIDTGGNKTVKKVIYKSQHDHYTLPTFWAYSGGKFHGLRIKHNGPLEITVLPGYMLVLRSVSEESIELQLSLGPTPKQLHDQQNLQTEKTTSTFLFDSYTCRDTGNLDLNEIVHNFNGEDVLDSYCVDKNLFMTLLLDDGRSNTTALDELLHKLHDQGKRFVLAVPPQIPAGSALHGIAKNLNILYTYEGSEYVGRYLSKKVVYPDYSSSRIDDYMKEFDSFIKKRVKIPVDGFALIDNWPQDDSFVMEDDDFPYMTKELREALSYTIPWNATSSNLTLHVLNHNTYGSAQVDAFNRFYPNHLILSASKSDVQTNVPTVLENVETSWDNLRNQIGNVLFNSITGNHLVSVPVCGDTERLDRQLQETLCLRWYLVAATMPLLRVSSVPPWREPGDMYTKYGQKIAKKALVYHEMFRNYMDLTLSKAEPVVRPMFYDFYEHTETFTMLGQYMLGDKILIAHPLTMERRKLQVYLPRNVGVWYEIWYGDTYRTTEASSTVSVSVTESDLLGFVAQGSIIPFKITDAFDLTVALNCTGFSCVAEGQLLEEVFVNITASDTSIEFASTGHDCLKLNVVKVYKVHEVSRCYRYNQKKVCAVDSPVNIPYSSMNNCTIDQ